MTNILYFLLLAALPVFIKCAPSSKSSNKNDSDRLVTYDQRQTGKYNINVNIKDVAIITLGSENVSSDIGVTSDGS